MLTRWESHWALIRTVCAVVQVAMGMIGLCLVIHYNHLLFHK